MNTSFIQITFHCHDSINYLFNSILSLKQDTSLHLWVNAWTNRDRWWLLKIFHWLKLIPIVGSFTIAHEIKTAPNLNMRNYRWVEININITKQYILERNIVNLLICFINKQYSKLSVIIVFISPFTNST